MRKIRQNQVGNGWIPKNERYEKRKCPTLKISALSLSLYIHCILYSIGDEFFVFCYCCCCFLPFSDTCTRIQSQKHSAHIQNEIILLAFRDAWTINENLQHSTIHSHSVTQTYTNKHGPKIHIQRQRDRGRRTHILIMEKLTNKKENIFPFLFGKWCTNTQRRLSPRIYVCCVYEFIRKCV